MLFTYFVSITGAQSSPDQDHDEQLGSAIQQLDMTEFDRLLHSKAIDVTSRRPQPNDFVYRVCNHPQFKSASEGHTLEFMAIQLLTKGAHLIPSWYTKPQKQFLNRVIYKVHKDVFASYQVPEDLIDLILDYSDLFLPISK